MFGEMQLAERVGFETGVRAVPIHELVRCVPVVPEWLLIYSARHGEMVRCCKLSAASFGVPVAWGSSNVTMLCVAVAASPEDHCSPSSGREVPHDDGGRERKRSGRRSPDTRRHRYNACNLARRRLCASLRGEPSYFRASSIARSRTEAVSNWARSILSLALRILSGPPKRCARVIAFM
jgi:hypothetical protein